MSRTDAISQAMTARSDEGVMESFLNGNVDGFKKWAPDWSRQRIADGIAQRNLMAAFINRLRHEYESAGLWYLHGIITGYLAREKPPYVPTGKKQVQYPVLSVDGVRDCVSWLQKYASSYATANVKKLYLLFNGSTLEEDNEKYVQLHRYRVLFDEGFESQDNSGRMIFAESHNLNPVWQRYLEVPSTYKEERRAKAIERTVLLNPGNPQLAEEAILKLECVDTVWRLDQDDPDAADLKAHKIAAYNQELRENAVASKAEVTSAKERLYHSLDAKLQAVIENYSDDEKSKFLQYEQLLSDIQSKNQEYKRLVTKAAENERGHEAVKQQIIADVTAKKEAAAVLLNELRKPSAGAVHDLQFHIPIIAKHLAKERFWIQLEGLHRLYRADPVEKLGKLIGSVEPHKNQLLGVQTGIPVGSMEELRHLFFYFFEQAPEVWKSRIPQVLGASQLEYVDAAGDRNGLEKSDITKLTAIITQEVTAGLESWLVRLAKINLSDRQNFGATNALKHKLFLLRNQLVKSVDPQADQNLTGLLESDSDMLSSPTTLSARCLKSAKTENSIKNRVEIVAKETQAGVAFRRQEIMAQLQQLGILAEESKFWLNPVGGGGFAPASVGAWVQKFIQAGRTDYNDLLHLVARNIYKGDMSSIFHHLLMQGALVKTVKYDASVVAVMYQKASLASENQKSTTWQLFALTKIVEDLFEAEAGNTWLSDKTDAIIRVVCGGSDELFNFYKRRDGSLIEEIVRRLVLELYLTAENERKILESDSFHNLLQFWRYRELGVLTPQTILEGDQSRGSDNSQANVQRQVEAQEEAVILQEIAGQGEVEQKESEDQLAEEDFANKLPQLTMRGMRADFLSLVKRFFTEPSWKNLLGVRILAESNFSKKKALISDSQSDQYRTAACYMDLTLKGVSPLVSPADLAAVKEELAASERRREEDLAASERRWEEEAAAAEERHKASVAAVKAESDAKLAAVKEELATSERRREEDLAAAKETQEKAKAESDAKLAAVQEELVGVKEKLVASERRREEDAAAAEERHKASVAAVKAESDANLAAFRETQEKQKAESDANLAAFREIQEKAKAESDAKLAAFDAKLSALLQAGHERSSGQTQINNPGVSSAIGAEVSAGGSVVAVSVLNRAPSRQGESMTRDREPSGSSGGAAAAQ